MRMKQQVGMAATIACALTLSSCWSCLEGEGEITERSFELGSTEEIELNVSANVNYWLDPNSKSTKVVIRVEDNLHELIEVNQNKGELEIGTDGCVSSSEMSIDIISPALSELSVNGSGDFISKTPIKTEEMELTVSGSGNIVLEVDAEDLDLTINGSGNMNLKGEAVEMDVNINGSGDIEASDLKTVETDIQINGSGDCNVYVKEKLEVEINGSGNVNYKWNPKKLEQEINGSGDVVQLNQAI